VRDAVQTLSPTSANLRLEKIAFANIPHQSKLFLDYLAKPLELTTFYPIAVSSLEELRARVPEVLANYPTDRDKLADALKAMNERWNASPQTFDLIERLREKDAVAIVTGQQAGLFTGSLYTIYKAFSTIKTAEKLRLQGVNAVPIFWIASEDHDFAEVAKTFVQNREGLLSEVEITTSAENEGLPVGKIVLDSSINVAVEALLAELPKTEFSNELESLIRESYQPKVTMSDAFARLMARLFRDYGLILLDPLDETLKELASPIYDKAVEYSTEITSALLARSRELESAGYHSQVLVEEDSFPLFWIDDTGKRQTLRRAKDGKIQSKVSKTIYLPTDLRKTAAQEPSRLSPNATLRATVQDYLLPTLCYFGGAAEVAYFAQTSEVYRILQRPATPIFHRASLTVIEPNVNRTLERYSLDLADFFEKPEILQAKIVEKFLNSDVSKTFAEVEEIINAQINRLDRTLLPIEPTLSESLGKRRRKIMWHIGSLRQKFYQAEIRRHETANRRLENAFNALYPHKGLQERTLNVTSLIARHGTNILDWIYDAIDTDTKEHQILFL
jgi:bacillithiol synthase